MKSLDYAKKTGATNNMEASIIADICIAQATLKKVIEIPHCPLFEAAAAPIWSKSYSGNNDIKNYFSNKFHDFCYLILFQKYNNH